MSYFFMFILAQANTTSLQQIRPLDLFCYYAICAMALKFEIACGDDAQYNTESLCALGATLPDAKWWRPFSKEPDAKWWKPFSNGGGENAFKEKPELFTSALNPNGNWYYVCIQVQLLAFDKRHDNFLPLQRPGSQGVRALRRSAQDFRTPSAFVACVPFDIPGRRNYAHDQPEEKALGSSHLREGVRQ